MNFYGFAHVTLVFFTRTLSNSFESFLFLALISAVHSNLLSIFSQSKQNFSLIFSSISIGIISSLGIFNRPTFPIFALIPILYWLTMVVTTTKNSIRFPLFLIFVTFFSTSFVLIQFDSFYYGENWVISPLNFLRYNVDTTKLIEHGLHPPWLHFCVNAFILFGPLHFCAVFWLISRLKFIRTFSLNVQTSKSIRNPTISTFFAFLYFFPFVPLSFIPHQEVRFLLPLIFPLILLVVPFLIEKRYDRPIFSFWCFFNLIFTLLYGHFHQGGLIPALRYVHQTSISSKNFLITHHTYMPPDYLVRTIGQEKNIETNLVDLQGASPEKLQLTIEHFFQTNENRSIKLFVLLPFCRRNDLNIDQRQRIRKTLIKQFAFHLDFDHPIESFHLDQFKLELYRLEKN